MSFLQVFRREWLKSKMYGVSPTAYTSSRVMITEYLLSIVPKEHKDYQRLLFTYDKYNIGDKIT